MSRIALTPGEPAGIGPDLCVKIAQLEDKTDIVLIADPELLESRARQLKLPLRLHETTTHATALPRPAGACNILPVKLAAPAECGIPNSRNAFYVLESLNIAVQGCMAGHFAALTTGPVNKAIINQAGIPFSGHTEYLAARCGSDSFPVMMLACPGLRVALATTHLPLRDVPAMLTRERLTRTLEVLHADLVRRFGIARPVILVCGLNPHAGEGGHLGNEENTVIAPVVRALREAGMHLDGPLPADTAFTAQRLDGADAVLAMYHDQGLPVLKHLGFGKAVNITLGLPIIRTSVDHGTALDLAGTGRADTGSLSAALDAALDMIRQQTH